MSEETIVEVYQGDLTSIFNVRPVYDGLTDVLSSDWKCYQGVNDCSGNPVIAKEEVTAKVVDINEKQRFRCALTPTQTEVLTAPNGYSEEYDWIIELVNNAVTPAYNREYHIRLMVKKQGL